MGGGPLLICYHNHKLERRPCLDGTACSFSTRFRGAYYSVQLELGQLLIAALVLAGTSVRIIVRFTEALPTLYLWLADMPTSSCCW